MGLRILPLLPARLCLCTLPPPPPPFLLPPPPPALCTHTPLPSLLQIYRWEVWWKELSGWSLNCDFWPSSFLRRWHPGQAGVNSWIQRQSGYEANPRRCVKRWLLYCESEWNTSTRRQQTVQHSGRDRHCSLHPAHSKLHSVQESRRWVSADINLHYVVPEVIHALDCPTNGTAIWRKAHYCISVTTLATDTHTCLCTDRKHKIPGCGCEMWTRRTAPGEGLFFGPAYYQLLPWTGNFSQCGPHKHGRSPWACCW